MVIDFLKFTSRLSTRQWSLISLCLHQDPLRGNGYWFPYVHIKTLYEAMVIDFLMFTSRLSTRQWSLISLCLHHDPLWDNGHWFPHVHIKTLFKVMVMVFLYIEALYETMVINFFTSRPSARQWSLISLSDRDPLHGNVHLMFRI